MRRLGRRHQQRRRGILQLQPPVLPPPEFDAGSTAGDDDGRRQGSLRGWSALFHSRLFLSSAASRHLRRRHSQRRKLQRRRCGCGSPWWGARRLAERPLVVGLGHRRPAACLPGVARRRSGASPPWLHRQRPAARRWRQPVAPSALSVLSLAEFKVKDSLLRCGTHHLGVCLPLSTPSGSCWATYGLSGGAARGLP